MNMYEEAAANLDKAIKDKLGEDYTTEDLLRFQMDEGLVTPDTTGDYNLKNKFMRIKEAQVDLPKKEQMSDRKINDQLASETNSSLSRVYAVTRDASDKSTAEYKKEYQKGYREKNKK